MSDPHFIVYEGMLDTASMGGERLHFLGLGGALARQHAQLFLLTPQFRGSPAWPDLEGSTHLQVAVRSKNLRGLALYELRKIVVLWKLRRRVAGQGILLTRLGISSWSTAVARIMGYRVIVEVNGLPEDEFKDRGFGPTVRVAVSAMTAVQYWAAHEMVAVTEGIGDRLRAKHRSPVTVIPNGADPATSPPADAAVPEHIRALAARPPGAPLLVFVGSFAPWHDLVLLVQGLRLLRDRTVVDWRLAVVGDGEGRDDFLTAIRSAGLIDSVTWLGRQPNDEVRRVLRIADVGAVPLRSKGGSDVCGSPLKLFEYLAEGLPVVAADVDGVRELRYPLLFRHPEGDLNAFVQACEDAYRAPRLNDQQLRDLQLSVSWDDRARTLLKIAEGLRAQ